MFKTQHYLQHHKQVALSLWGRISDEARDIIASDVDHLTETFKWFEAKVEADALRLYEDPLHRNNNPYSFRVAGE